MRLRLVRLTVVPLLAALHALPAQDGSADRQPGDDPRILLRYAAFDPLAGLPQVPATVRSGADTHLWIVQFQGPPTDRDRAAVRTTGAVIHGYLPHDCHVVRMDQTAAANVLALPCVRWAGAYEPAYRLEPFLLAEHLAGKHVPVRRYDLVMADKRGDKQALEAKVKAIGGAVFDRHLQGLLFTADLSGAQLLAAARFDEVLWIDRWSPPGEDIDNARVQGGANTIETVAGYTGTGIRGHVYEGCEFDHPDFVPAMTNVRSGGQQQRHGHCTAGILFGEGTNNASCRGLAPDATGFYTNYNTVTAGWSRNMVIGDVVNVHNCMFTTASWGAAQTPAYTATSADADDIVFDHRIPWTNSMSNLGNQNVRPEAWAKNVISVGGVQHFDNSNPADDSWLAGNASIGPAADGRMKPDLAAYYDSVRTSDLSFGLANNDPTAPGTTGGYNNVADPAGQYTTGFGGTSAATPIVAGHNALAIQMYTDHLFNNPPRVVGGSRFQNRPFAQTLKALMICGADLYTPTATDNRREHVGWGFPNLNNLYSRRHRFTVVPEDVPIVQGATHTYQIQVLSGETLLKVCMTYLDPAGNPAAAQALVNDLTLRVVSPGGTIYQGNVGLKGAGQTNQSIAGGAADTIDTVECVVRNNPPAGVWTIQITAPTLTTDAHLATGATDATYALVVNGGTRLFGSGCARYVPDVSPTSAGGNYFPFGGYAPSSLGTIFTGGSSLVSGGTVFFDVTVSTPLYLTALDLNVAGAAGTDVFADVYRTAAGGTHIGNETNPVWLPMTAARGTSAGANVATAMELSEPFFLPAGTYGFAVHANNFGHAYTVGTGANQNYSNLNLAVACGTSKTGAPGAAGTVFNPRVANMTLRYRPDGATGTNIRWQTIVRREELGPAGDITGLAFSSQVTGRHWNSSLLVRMSHVAAGSTLSSTFATNLPLPITVLNASNHSFPCVADQWQELGLQTAFAYNGFSDLVIDVVARGNWQTTPGAFHDSDEPRVFNAMWTGAVPFTGTTDTDQSLRVRVSLNCASASEHGSSCGRLAAAHFGDGHRGAIFLFQVNDALPGSVAVISLGLTNGAPLPLALTPFGWTNCLGWNDPVVLSTVGTSAAGIGLYGLNVPNNPALDGAIVYGQWLQPDPNEPGGLTFSGHTRMIVGLTP